MLQRKPATLDAVASVPMIVDEVVNSPGQPLDASTRAFMELRLGHDFSKVRVHTDHHASESARAVNALAYTVGKNIVFERGAYAPTSGPGRKLLAHELVHTIQQSGAQHARLYIGPAADPMEQQAEAGSRRVMSGLPISSFNQASSMVIQRQITHDAEVDWEHIHPAGMIDRISAGEEFAFILWNFAVDSADLKPEHRRLLFDRVLRPNRTLSADTELILAIEGHSSSSGTSRENERISLARARAVQIYLSSRGFHAQMDVQGYGASHPRLPNDTPEHMAMNRRVELRTAMGA